MSAADGKLCPTCLCFEKHTGLTKLKGGAGRCRAHPPGIGLNVSGWPLVGETDWCQEWQPVSDADTSAARPV